MKTKQEVDDVKIPLPPSTHISQAKLEENEKDKKAAIKSITDGRRASAWQLHRWPIEKSVIWNRSRVHLPRTYLATAGEDVCPVREGADLNYVVHQYYMETIDPKSHTWVNYVHADNVIAKRHEFLGPDPRVAGYFFDIDGDIHIRWWDGFLLDQWIDKGKWKVQVTLNEEGKWTEKVD